MHFTTSAVVGILAASSVATAFQFPDNVPMSKRQTEGPSYECHANCGYAIQTASGDYCKSDKWLGLLKGCLDCANEFNIWQYYGTKVGAAAKACGLDATPKPAGNGGSSSAVAASSAPAASSSQAASQAASTPVASTPAGTIASSTPAAQSSAAQTAAGSSSAASAASSAPPAVSSSAGHSNTTTVVTGGAEKQQVGLVLAAGVLAAAWM